MGEPCGLAFVLRDVWTARGQHPCCPLTTLSCLSLTGSTGPITIDNFRYSKIELGKRTPHPFEIMEVPTTHRSEKERRCNSRLSSIVSKNSNLLCTGKSAGSRTRRNRRSRWKSIPVGIAVQSTPTRQSRNQKGPDQVS